MTAPISAPMPAIEPPGHLRLSVILGLLCAMGPFAIDMYLPSLPSIGQSLHASGDQVQYTLMGFFIALGCGQLIYGPLSDMIGRKTPLYLGLGLYILASVGCALSTSVEMLIAFRVVQGLGGCVGFVVAQAIVRDLYTGPEAAKLMSLLMLVFSVSPILAPLVGSLLVEFASWRAVFWAVTVAALCGIALNFLFLDETRPAAQRTGSSIRSAAAAYLMLLKDGEFMVVTLVGAFGISSFFVFLANSSFVYIGHYGLTPIHYGFAFSLNAIAFIGMAQATGWLAKRFGLDRMLWLASLGYAAAMVVLLVVATLGFDGLPVVTPLLFIGYGMLGLVLPATSVLALDAHGDVAGTAASLMGTIQLLIGALVISVAGLIVDGTPRPMIVGIAVCAVITVGFAWISVRQRRQPGTEQSRVAHPADPR